MHPVRFAPIGYPYFRLTALPDTYDEALLAIEAGSADVVLEIPRDLEKDWVKGEAPR